MNVRISYETDFPAAFYLPPDPTRFTVMVNRYHLRLDMVTMSEDHSAINTAMERLKVFIADHMTHTVFVNQVHREQIGTMMSLGMNTTSLPEEPVDQIVGLMLFAKLNAIMCGRIRIHSLDLASDMGDGIWFGHMDHESQGPFAQDGWWNLSNTSHNDVAVMQSPNVSHLAADVWKQYDLEWPDETRSAVEAKVLYADFTDNATK